MTPVAVLIPDSGFWGKHILGGKFDAFSTFLCVLGVLGGLEPLNYCDPRYKTFRACRMYVVRLLNCKYYIQFVESQTFVNPDFSSFISKTLRPTACLCSSQTASVCVITRVAVELNYITTSIILFIVAYVSIYSIIHHIKFNAALFSRTTVYNRRYNNRRR